MHTVVVESPAKAKTINKYLGKDYQVVASFGHVRDLPSKEGSVRPDEDFAMDYALDEGSKKHMSAIAAAVKSSDTLYLATDPDREGEAISWHVVEALKARRQLPKSINVQRITFHEITKNAVQKAINEPRAIDMDLVNAQQARRALDYLVGFTLSPVLWRKLPGARSAGRVQSVALRLICERDAEIEQFVSREYWTVTTQLTTQNKDVLKASLTHWENTKLEKFSLTTETEATAVAKALEGAVVTVDAITPKQMRRNPFPPFTTSTLQMDASRRLGFGAKRTMTLAQKLYEGVDLGGETTGLITYMRTDGVQVSEEAIGQARGYIGKQFGERYLPKSARRYSTKAKNAQEAHEAIRPTDITRTPENLKKVLDEDQLKLYTLIWKRMVASQMEAAVYDQVAVTFQFPPKQATLRASGSVLKFDGFLTLYREGMDDDQKDEEENNILPPLKEKESLSVTNVTPNQHFTEPPPRFTEASLVKRLEELGIGRPSTYASIISVLQDRGYVRLERKRFIAEMRGRLVNTFLVSFFQQYVEYDFTANLEQQLDEISDGKLAWKQVLKEFWDAFHKRIQESKEVPTKEVLDALDEALAPFVFGKAEVTAEDRVCPSCANGSLHLKTGKFGAFLGCVNYPECNYTRQLGTDESGVSAESGVDNAEYPKSLGMDPETGLEVWLKKGPYGFYVQLGEEKKPKRASLPKGQSPEMVELAQALSLLQLPRDVGEHPETGKMITAGIGRYGPYIHHEKKYVSLKGDDDVLTIGMNRAVALLAEQNKKQGNAPLRVIGEHPDGGEIGVYSGRYGPYVKHGKVNASLGKGDDVETLSLEAALALLAKRAAAPKKKATKRKSAS